MVVSTKTKVGLLTEDDTLPFSSHSMTVWHGNIAVCGDTDVVLRAVAIAALVYVVLHCAAVCQ